MNSKVVTLITSKEKKNEKLVRLIEILANVDALTDKERRVVLYYYELPERFRNTPFSLSVRNHISKVMEIDASELKRIVSALDSKRWIYKHEMLDEYVFMNNVEQLIELGHSDFQLGIKIKEKVNE